MARIQLFDPEMLDSITLGQLFDMVTAWAPLDAAMQTAKAEKDKREAEFAKENEERFKLATYEIAQDHAAGLAQIQLVMSKHPDWFEKRGCKERRTDNAVFGFRKAKDTVTVVDIEALKDFSDAEGLKLYDVEVKPITAAIRRELKDRDVIPGVSVKPGTPKPFAEAIMRNLDESRKGN